MIDFEFPSSLLALVLFTLDPPLPPRASKASHSSRRRDLAALRRVRRHDRGGDAEGLRGRVGVVTAAFASDVASRALVVRVDKRPNKSCSKQLAYIFSYWPCSC